MMLREAYLVVILLGFSVCISVAESNEHEVAPLEVTPKSWLSLDRHGKFNLSWSVDRDLNEITFEVEVETAGYVGLGISPNGGMLGADIFIGGVADDVYYSDRFGVGNMEPKVDNHSDWTLLEAQESLNKTYLKFSRKLETCDDQDIPIKEGTHRLIWAYGASDEISWHGADNRGVFLTHLLGGSSPSLDSAGLKNWTISMEMEMPRESTTYWCTLHRLPRLEKKHHIVAFEPVLPDENALRHVHHFIIHKCRVSDSSRTSEETFDNSTVENGRSGSNCYMPHDALMANCEQFLYGWAVGGQKITFPANVGWPIGETNETEYWKLEIHYDNPKSLSGVLINAGVNVFYTDQLRELDAGALTIGHGYGFPDSQLIIPPNRQDFVVAGHCSSGCTQRYLPQSGISVFNVLMHSHISGRKLKIRHFRNRIELPYIDKDDNYDFNYQQSKPLLKDVRILPGDHLTYECTYDSRWKGPNKVVIGGFSTEDEMCLAYMYYYPRVPTLGYCLSSGGLSGNTEFDVYEKYRSARSNGVLEGDGSEKRMFNFESYLNKNVNWTEDFIKRFENDRRFGTHRSFCDSGIFLSHTDERTKYPEIEKEFEEPNVCAVHPDKSEEINKELADQIMHHGLNLMSELLGRK